MKANAPTPTSSGTASAVAALPSPKSTRACPGEGRGRANGRHPPVPADPVLAVIERAACDPTVDVDKMQRLLDMRAGLAREAAERAFNEALAAAQAEMHPISKNAANPQTQSRYASLAQLDRALRPVYSTHGFAVTFDTEPAPAAETVRAVCYLSGHGHTRRYQLDMPADGKGPKGGDAMSRTHAVASAVTYGRRYLLCMAFNIATEDDDGNAAGAKPKSAYQARRENHYPQLERAIRGAQTLEELARVWSDARPIIAAWPARWRDHIVLEKDNRKAALTGTMDALEASLQYLEDGHV